MKAVLMSTQPKWCELIASGKKTVEVRKTKPKLETPFKVYIYQTRRTWIYDIYSRISDWQGKVVGEFVCGGITSGFLITPWGDFIQRKTCLTYREIHDYGKNKPLFFWHISDLIIYDEPKELGEFRKPCNYDLGCKCCSMYFPGTMFAEPYCKNGNLEITRPPQSWCYVEEV